MSSFRRLLQALVIAVGLAAAAGLVETEQPAGIDTARIEQITGLKGTFSKQEDVFKVTKPRNDVTVQVDERIMFLHYWGKGKAVDLAKGVKAALYAQSEVGR